jgi:hypothetical protein
VDPRQDTGRNLENLLALEQLIDISRHLPVNPELQEIT